MVALSLYMGAMAMVPRHVVSNGLLLGAILLCYTQVPQSHRVQARNLAVGLMLALVFASVGAYASIYIMDICTILDPGSWSWYGAWCFW